MATAAAESNTNLQQTTSGPGSLAARKSVFAQNRIPGMKRESDIDQIMRTGSSQSPKRSLNSESERRSNLHANKLQAQQNPPRLPAQSPSLRAKDEMGKEAKKQMNIQAAMQVASIKGALSESMGIAPDELEKQEGETDEEAEERLMMTLFVLALQFADYGEVAEELKAKGTGKRSLGTILSQIIFRRLIKKFIPKMAKIIANSVVSALDLGTGGISLLITIFVRLITLGHSNVEMVYGTWIKKGQSRVIGGVSWFPIPLFFIDKNAYGVQGLIILQDLILIVFVTIMIALDILMIFAMNPAGQLLLITYFGKQAFSAFF
ncbi:MAG: hypothetical protein NTX72_05425 [Candidatus Uhrbacteria bacterium]|nr:hypothetical protein [Candidatus Uhrbacteria bacterium]